jgi:vacuolar-type H+-ATPase subunit C/Vma6
LAFVLSCRLFVLQADEMLAKLLDFCTSASTAQAVLYCAYSKLALCAALTCVLQADETLAKFLDFCTYGHMIDNVVLIVTGTLHERDVQVCCTQALVCWPCTA